MEANTGEWFNSNSVNAQNSYTTMTRKAAADLSMMTHVPLQPIWLARLPAFQSGDARIVRGCLNMLMAAFHGQPAGSLPNTPEALATTAQLPLDVAVENFKLLTAGWKMGKTSIVFEPMLEMAQRLHSDYSDALQRLQDGVVVAINAPDLFNSELLLQQGSSLAMQVGAKTQRIAEDAMADTNVKRRLPEGATYSGKMAKHMADKGFANETHQEIWNLFADYHRSRQTASASWESEFRNWLANQIRYGKLVPTSGEVPEVFRPAMTASPAASGPRFTFSRPNKEVLQSTATDKLERARFAVQAMRGGMRG